MVQFCVFESGNLSRSHDCAWVWCCQLKHCLQCSIHSINPQKFIRMPQKKHIMKVRGKNAKGVRNVRAQSHQGELCQPLQQMVLKWCGPTRNTTATTFSLLI